jgi:hypothetical protein
MELKFYERQLVKAGLSCALFIALDHTSTALVFGSKGSSTLLQEQVDVVVLLSWPSCNCCTGLAFNTTTQVLSEHSKGLHVILAMFVDVFDLTFLASRERSLLAKLCMRSHSLVTSGINP